MQNELNIDPKIIEEILKFSKNIIEAPKFVSAPDEINLEVTPYKVIQEIDKTRLLHYEPITEIKYKTPLLISYALINRFHILHYIILLIFLIIICLFNLISIFESILIYLCGFFL